MHKKVGRFARHPRLNPGPGAQQRGRRSLHDMRHPYPHLAGPVRLGATTVPNAIAFAPVHTGWATKGLPSQNHINHYGRIAAGGSGLVIVEATAVSPDGAQHQGQLGLWSDQFIAPLERISREIHRHNVIPVIQLNHGGPRSPSAVIGGPPLAASAGVRINSEPATQATASDINRIVDAFVRAAKRAQQAGFAGIELHAAHFYLLSTFLSGFANQRSDDWGGTLENRARIVLDTLCGVRELTGPGFMAGVRINGTELLPGGLTVWEASELARLMTAAGADFIHVSAYAAPVAERYNNVLRVGSTPGADSPEGVFLPYAAEIRQASAARIIAVGKITSPELAQTALERGQADMIALGRALIRDPDFPVKAFSGRRDEILQCVGCSRCFDTVGDEPPICWLNRHRAG